MKLLIVEDHFDLQQAIRKSLEQSGFLCETASSVKVAEEKINLYEYDILILDLNFPDGTGLDLIRLIKKINLKTGILVVSARNALDQRIEGIELGADDYLTKPFEMAELIVRVKSILRRRNFGGSNHIISGELSIDPEKRMLEVKGQKVDLTKSEFDLLLFFVSNPNRVLSRESLAEHIWGDNMDLADSFDFIYSHIKNLRKKISTAGGYIPIRAVYGIGYKLE